MKLCMIGTGYVGLVSGVCFSDLGNDVICVDKDINKINNLIKQIGSSFNLSESNMNSCLKSTDAQDDVLDQRIQAQKKYKIESTPTIVVNEKKYKGKVDYENFKKIVERNL